MGNKAVKLWLTVTGDGVIYICAKCIGAPKMEMHPNAIVYEHVTYIYVPQTPTHFWNCLDIYDVHEYMFVSATVRNIYRAFCLRTKYKEWRVCAAAVLLPYSFIKCIMHFTFEVI